MRSFKKMFLAACLLTVFTLSVHAQSVGINADGSSPNSSAMLDVSSTAKGFLAPRMTAEQRAAITSPATGLLVYQTDAPAGYYYNSGIPASPAWVQLGAASGASQWTTTGSNIYYNIGNIGIGTNAPAEKLHVDGNIKLNSYNKGDNFGIFFRDGESLGLNMAITAHDWTSSNESSDGLLISAWDGIGFMFGSNTFDVSKVAMMVSNTGNVGIGTATPAATLDVNGLALSNFEGFSYYTSGTTLTAGTWSELVISTLDYNTFTGTPYNTSTSEFTAPRAGFYRFSLFGYAPTANTTALGDRYEYGVRINGTLKGFAGGNYSNTDSPLTTYSQVVRLAAGDVIRPAMFTAIAVTLGIGSGAGHYFYFQGEFVGK